MNMSNEIANMILHMLEQDGFTEIQRNDFAQRLGCVPSQINYVISSRFTPEHGYIVESRRGGGGYVRISRVSYDKGAALMHVINSVGESLDENTCRAHIKNLHYQNLLSDEIAAAGLAVTSDRALHQLEPETRDKVRASVFKHILLSTIQKGR
ncbi:MAG: CtsR family transcriptional regulator [Clostridia bacterium]|nr:CtsR family transcriptional regulator [Clostridia bacterium]